MERINYREIVQKLVGLDQRLREMGLKQHDRMRIHQRNIGAANEMVLPLPALHQSARIYTTRILRGK